MAAAPVPLSDRVFLLAGPASTFVLREGCVCVAVDTGLTADAGRSVLKANRRNLEATRAATPEVLSRPSLAEEVTGRVLGKLGLAPTPEGYFLALSTIKGHLAALRDGLAAFRLEGGRLLWERR